MISKNKNIALIKKMPDYQHGKIYKIINEELKGLVYYGSTTETLKQRFSKHKSSLNCSSKTLFSVGYPEIILLEDYPCETKADLLKRERYWIKGNECINCQIPGRTQKQHYQDNKEKIVEYKKQHYQDNKKQIELKSKEKFECECGGKYTYSSKSRHMKSKKHIKFISSKQSFVDAIGVHQN